jgi:cellulose synthase/poly-beta-1,6-N-acetylglucosamine synthase-like glycosyltransferase
VPTIDWTFVLNVVFVFVVVYFFSINTIYLSILLISIIAINRRRRFGFSFDLEQAFKFRLLPPVSIILPAYNEEKTIVESVRSLLFIRYPSFEVIVVNDGSKDRTLEILKEAFNLIKTDYIFRRSINTEPVRGIYISKEFKNIIVIDKENGGKADALNAGINVSHYPYFCAIDADTILGSDALAKLIMPFVNEPERTVAVGGVVKAANGAEIQSGRLLRERLTKNILVILQGIEYARSFFMGRMGLSTINCLLIISGAFGLFKKEDVLQIEGYKRRSLGEDMMLVVKLHKLKRSERKRYRVAFVHDTVCWTELPFSIRVLKKQRLRWQMGLMESLFENRDVFFNPKYGSLGLFAFPFYFFSEIVPPFLELIAYAVMVCGLISKIFTPGSVFHFFLVSWVYSILHSFIAISMDHYIVGTTLRFSHFLIRIAASFVENLFYRQLNIFYRVCGLFKYYAKVKEWGEMDRSGYK